MTYSAKTYPVQAYLNRGWFILWLITLISGCTSTPDVKTEPDTTLTLTIDAGFYINGTRMESTAPLQARLYELQSPELFEKADFLDIYLKDISTLQDTLIKKHTLPTIQPDSHASLSFTLDKATHYIAILAEFADYQTARPTVVYPIIVKSENIVTLYIFNNHLRLSDPQKTTPPETDNGL
ncbi:type VI secretion system-associated lipoprotein [Endozoicomonas sp. (ex Bugula neritina AB1)]|nr:type VI secretion system-associated lipoprotein [Endozoicomonas sp. (ex Bugula neritina AB1)]